MHVMIAGATGAVGRLLVPRLLAAGHQVTGTSRTPAGVERVQRQGASAVQVDVFDRDGLLDAVTTAAAAALADDPDVPFLGYLEADSSVSSFVHVADAATAAVAALDWPGGPVNIVDDEPAPGREWVPVLASALGWPAPEARPGRLSWARGASNGLARSRGWRPEYPTWRTGFAMR